MTHIDPVVNLISPAHDLLSDASSFIMRQQINEVFHKHDFTWEHIMIRSHVDIYLMSLGELKWKKRHVKIESSSELKPSRCASALWTQMYIVGGEDPCRLMKLIISNHSSSMKENNDEKADTHMCVLLHSTGMDKRTWAKYDVMQAINTSPIQYNVLCCIIHERFLLFCPSSVESMLLLHCTYKNAASIIYTCIFGMSTNKVMIQFQTKK